MATKTPIVAGKRLEAGDTIEVNVKGEDGKVRGGKATVSERIEVYDLTDPKILEAIEKGKILAWEDTVSKIETKYVVYTKLEAVDLESMKLLAGGDVDLELELNEKTEKIESKFKQKTVASLFNAGLDMDAKRRVRMTWDLNNQDPAKIIDRTIKALVASGYTQDEAKELAMGRKFAKNE